MKPTPQQLEWQRAEYGMFCHFGINTYYGKEWSDGTLSPAAFNPTKFDARQWVETAQEAGMRYLILTAKHHDGFCLWPTETTDYSLASSPYKDGKGDIVGEVTEACREAGMPFGLYLSPWDRHEPCYKDAEAYDAFYLRQLTELCTRYGPLFEVWFDGAGSDGRIYDWDAIMAVVEEHHPEAMVFNMGRPTIRWVGNEDGLAADPNPYVVGGVPGTGGYTDSYLVEVTFPEPVTFDHLTLQESLKDGQHIDGYRAYSDDGSLVAEGRTIGHKRLHVFPNVTSQTLRLKLNSPEAKLDSVSAYLTGTETLPEVKERMHDDPEFTAMVD